MVVREEAAQLYMLSGQLFACRIYGFLAMNYTDNSIGSQTTF